MQVGKITQLTTVRVIKRADRGTRDDESLRSLEISQMRILARKYPEKFLDIASEIVLDTQERMTA